MIRAATLSVLRLVTAAMLALDAYVHADLARLYDNNRDATLTQGDVFRIEAGLAAFAALAVLVLTWGTVWALLTWALAIVVAASALGAVMIYAHYEIGRLGPLPDMYEPLWYSEKRQAAIAEGIATATATIGFVLTAIPALARRRNRASLATAGVRASRSNVGGRAR
jgi:hypothetical protein